MAKAKKKVGKSSSVKKQWFKIHAPKLFNEQVIGEAYLAEIANGIGRQVPVNMMNLTGDMKRQNITIMFKTNNATANKLMTEVIGYQIQPSSIKRMVKRGKNKVDFSFSAVTSDGIKVQIKTILVTLRATNLSYLTSLRNVLKENLTRTLAKMKYEVFVSDLVNHKIQSILKNQLKKIFPLRTCEIRYMKVTGKGKPPVLKEPKKKVVKEEAPKKAEEKKE